MRGSLQQRLIWILIGLTLSAWLASAGITYFYAQRVMLQQVDRQLEQYADLVTYITGVFARQLDNGLPLYESWTGHDYDLTHLQPIVIDAPFREGVSPVVNVWEEGRLIAIFADSPRFQAPQREGFETISFGDDGTEWRTLTRYGSPALVWIRVGVEMGDARQSIFQSLSVALKPLLVVLPLTLLVLYFGVIRGLAPLRNLADQISRRNPGVLDPVDTDAVPSEVEGVVNALNALLQRLATALESEQRFTANAAHELMTPLAAIKTEVQLCQRQLSQASDQTNPGNDAMLERIAQRVDRASHSVEQLLVLARVDPDTPMPLTQVSLQTLLQEVLVECAHLAADRQIEVNLQADDELLVAGNREALAILLRNLLVNAFRYASDASAIDVNLSAESRCLSISNDCPPLSAAEFARLRDRFYRVPGSRGLGAGLGLSIVSRIAELHDASIDLTPAHTGSGFKVRVSFPQPD